MFSNASEVIAALISLNKNPSIIKIENNIHD
jgi:hypothetical protein